MILECILQEVEINNGEFFGINRSLKRYLVSNHTINFKYSNYHDGKKYLVLVSFGEIIDTYKFVSIYDTFSDNSIIYEVYHELDTLIQNDENN